MTAVLDRTTTAPKRVLMVVANPATSTTTGWPVGFWASELFHPLYEFSEVGYDVTLSDGSYLVEGRTAGARWARSSSRCWGSERCVSA
jgi:hypothetical protein